MDPTAVAGKTTDSVNALAELGVKVLLNKVDSTLRGNPGVELVAAMNAVSGDHAVLCSSYPGNRRIVEDGVLLVEGIPVAETDVGQDRLSPVPSSRVDEIVVAALRRAGIEDQAHVRGPGGGEAINDFLPVIITPDAQSDSDLQVLAERLVNADSQALVSGSAGVAVALAEVLGADRLVRRTAPRDPLVHGRRIFIVTASQRSNIDVQLEVLSEQIDLIQAELSVDETIAGIANESIEEMVEFAGQNGIAVLRVGKLLAVGATGDIVGPDEHREISMKITRNLASGVHEIVRRAAPDTLIVIGGDTARGVLDACRVTSLELLGELQPGTVMARSVDGTISDLLLVTRAGGFGGENALIDLVALLEFGHNV
jgi:uncharacterized protein YgbK (DUF1537 family)